MVRKGDGGIKNLLETTSVATPMTMNFAGRRIHGLYACGASADAKPSATMEIMFA